MCRHYERQRALRKIFKKLLNENRILIVGGTGFIGFHLSKSLIKSNFIFSISRQNPKKN